MEEIDEEGLDEEGELGVVTEGMLVLDLLLNLGRWLTC